MKNRIYKSLIIFVLLLAPLSIYTASTDVTPGGEILESIRDLYLAGTALDEAFLLEIDSLILMGGLPSDRRWMCVFLTAEDVDITGSYLGCCDASERFSIEAARDYLIQRNWVNYKKGRCEVGH
jgi:hypothetical protein